MQTQFSKPEPDIRAPQSKFRKNGPAQVGLQKLDMQQNPVASNATDLSWTRTLNFRVYLVISRVMVRYLRLLEIKNHFWKALFGFLVDSSSCFTILW